MIGSCVAHGVAYAALSGLPLGADPTSPQDTIELSIVVPETVPLGLPEPPPPAPPQRAAARVRPRASGPRPRETSLPVVAETALPEPASPPPLELGAALEEGLATAGGAGSGAGSGRGNGNGTATNPAPVPPTLDLRPIAAEWVRRVNRAISERAMRDYPRSALRARLQGSVLLAVQVDTRGRLSGVEVKQSSGHPQLDDAALAAARALMSLPAPPDALRGRLRPIRIPVNYRVQ